MWKECRDFAFGNVKDPVNTPKWSLPFPHTVPSYPAKPKRKRDRSIVKKQAPNLNIPTHLPAFPPAYTYSQSRGKEKKTKISVDGTSGGGGDVSTGGGGGGGGGGDFGEVSKRDRKLAETRMIKASLSKIEETV